MSFYSTPTRYERAARRAEMRHARRLAFIAGALTVNPDLDDQQVQEMADAYLRHSREER